MCIFILYIYIYYESNLITSNHPTHPFSKPTTQPGYVSTRAWPPCVTASRRRVKAEEWFVGSTRKSTESYMRISTKLLTLRFACKFKHPSRRGFLLMQIIRVVVSSYFLCSPLFKEMIQFDEHIFSNGLKPPTIPKDLQVSSLGDCFNRLWQTSMHPIQTYLYEKSPQKKP